MSQQPDSIMDYGHTRALAKCGYEGQQFMAICKGGQEQWMVLGWCGKPCGGAFRGMVQAHPVWHRLVILDLDMDSIQLGVKLSTLPGCNLSVQSLRDACMGEVN